MTFSLDLKGYFRRIQLPALDAICPDTLNQIIAAHVQMIPFENLDILLGRPISTKIEAIEAKLVHAKRGGYCFEQNTLLLHVLRNIGFNVTPLSARVRVGQTREDIPARTHLFLRIELDGESWLADVGVGALSPSSALRLKLDEVQHTPHESRRFVAQGKWQGFRQRSPDAVLYHQAKLGNEWVDVCEFTLEPMFEIDKTIANWYTSAHPDSHFRHRLVVAKAEGNGRVSISNRELKFRDASGQSNTQTIHSRDDLRRTLKKHFGLEFDKKAQLNCAGLAWD